MLFDQRRGLIYEMRPQVRWRIEMVQPPPPNIRLTHAIVGLLAGVALAIYFKYPRLQFVDLFEII